MTITLHLQHEGDMYKIVCEGHEIKEVIVFEQGRTSLGQTVNYSDLPLPFQRRILKSLINYEHSNSTIPN